MKEKVFSIVVPVYNVEKYLTECIEASVFQIVDKGLSGEIILIDDGSTDASGEICDKYQKQYPDIVRVIHKQNEGLLLARRTGFGYAKGEYIINCDSDDFLSKNALNRIVEIIDSHHSDVIFYNAVSYIDDNNNKELFSDVFSQNSFSVVEKADVLNDYLISYRMVSMGCKAFKKDCLDTHKDYTIFGKIGFGEDALQSIEIYSNAEKFSYINEPLYYYRQGTGMTASFQEGYYGQFKTVFIEIENAAKQWKLRDIEQKLALKYFGILGRSITQDSRKDAAYSDRAKYFETIFSDSLVEQYSVLYKQIKRQLKMSHRLVCGLFLHRRFYLLHMMLSIKNI